ncbi:esterase [Paenibacillus albidus]|uniref:Esterase n=1 Tax=Paenibacillus albidus TaxID=2041023 RepID=A0A917C6Q0_9BACL|nr:alpha/beta hydrolase [Paenibacillus albidus]GGF74869.1 esterase [Paenibacillus albidus]
MCYSYNDSLLYWKQYQRFFPEEIRLKQGRLPTEEWWEWERGKIHLDRMPAAGARLKIISVHGAGGYGRLLAPYAGMLQSCGYEVVSPDLPPYGLSRTHSTYSLNYSLWVDLIAELIDREYAHDGIPVVLLGSSIGGMLAYHAAARNKRVKGLIATTFVDTSRPEVRDQLAPNRIISRLGKLAMDRLPLVLDSFKISVKHVSRMQFISNNTDLTRLIINDPSAAGTRIPLRLLRTFLNMQPEVQPEDFKTCPVLLVHPEQDAMTPIAFSEPFYNRLGSAKECVILEGAGHFPIEAPGLQQM